MTAHFVNQLDDLRRRSLRMASLVEDMLDEALEAAQHPDADLAQRVIERDEEVDAEEVQVEAEVIRLLALYQPVGSDLRLLCTVLKVNNDLERAADCAVNVAQRARHLPREAVVPWRDDVQRIAAAAQRVLRTAIQAYGSHDAAIARSVFAEEHVVDALYADIIRAGAAQTVDDPEGMASLLDVLSVAKNLERIADHATNIAEDVLYLATGEIVRHRTRDEQA